MTLTAINALRDVQTRYEQQTGKRKVNVLLTGDVGTGKTSALATLPAPVLVHSFDPGGEVVLHDAIAAGRVIIDSRFCNDSITEPTSSLLWEKEVKELESKGVFDVLGAYVIDSGTMFAQSVINRILAKNPTTKSQRYKNPFGIPQMEITDWGTLASYMLDTMRRCCNLPCNFVLTFHTALDKDELTAVIIEQLAMGGKTKDQLPILFDEFYNASITVSSKGLDYHFLTQREGRKVARTRLGAGGKLLAHEKPSFVEIFKKVGFPYEDRPLEAVKTATAG